MAAPTERMRGIVLRHSKLREIDLIITLLLDDGRRLDVMALGARKPGGRLAGRTELFDETDFLLVHGKGLPTMREAQLVDGHAGLRNDLDRTSAASCVVELARASCFEDASDPYLFAICSRALAACEQAGSRAQLDFVVAAYAFKLLAHGGWNPTLDRCVACGDEKASRFSVMQGGVLCESCASSVEGAEPIDSRELSLLRALIAYTFDELLGLEPDGPSAALMLSFAHAWAATHLDARLRAFEFFSGNALS